MKIARSLASSITLTLTVGLTGVMLLLALYMNREMQREVYDLISRKGESVLALQADNAALPLWNFDARQLQITVDNIAKGEDILSAHIISSDGAIDVSATHPSKMDAEHNAPSMTREIIFNDGGKPQNLGKLTIVPNYAEAAARINKFALRTLGGVGLLLVLLVCAVYAVARRAIAPVARLSAFMATSSLDAPPIRQSESSVIEVQQLFSALQQMRDHYIRYQKELIAEKEKAELANRVKSDFLATMSHELRTPLNSILGLTDIFIEDTPLTSEHHEMAVIIRKSSLVLLTLINDILDISKIESENLRLEKIKFDLKETISGVLQTLLPIASSKGLSLRSVYSQPDLFPFVIGDPVRVGRILTNLVGNALKYTESGSVTVEIDFHSMDEGKIGLECRVKDTGIGIPNEKLAMIFEKFTQADESITRKYGGTGLGLAIAKELVALMDGQIGVTSEVGKGSTFWFRVPLEKASKVQHMPSTTGRDLPRPGASASRKDFTSAKILIAEDHLLNQVLMKKVLGRMSAGRVDIRDNGMLALQAFIEQGDHDLIIMDCHMPVMNGYEATHAIREHEGKTGGHIPIVAMTADAMVGTREKCLAAGMDNYLTKPVDTKLFKKVLDQWFFFPDGKDESTSSGETKPASQEQPCVDISVLRGYTDTPEEARSFIDIFLKQSEADLGLLGEQRTDGQNETWKEIAHRLKGSCGGAGAVVMRQLCAEAQEMLVSTREEREEKYKKIAEAYEDVKAFFQKDLS